MWTGSESGEFARARLARAGVGRVNVPDFTRIFILSYCLTISNISSYHFAGFIDAGKILAFKNTYYFLTIVC